MRTKLWVVATLLVVIAMLAACGAAPEPETVVQTVEVEVEKTVVETVEVEVEKLPALAGPGLALGAVSIPAGMVHDPFSTAVVTALPMASHMSSAAVEDVEQYFVLLRAHGV